MTAPWTAVVLTLFPEMFPGPLGHSLAGKGLAEDRWRLRTSDIREHGLGNHRTVDDSPAGGGPGMVLRADVLAAAIDAAEAAMPGLPRLALSPRGMPLTQARAHKLAAGPGALLLCGRFEGMDERLFVARQVEEVCIGDYVLSGGELGAMVLIDAVVRLIPGVMGKLASSHDESFEHNRLEYPQYTRPRDWEGQAIPEVLLSGDHARIAAWRRAQSQALTAARRPDLLARQSSNS